MNKQRILIGLFFFAVTFSFSNNLVAQQELTLKDIYSNSTYSQKSYGPVRWMKDNEGYSTLEK